MESLRLLLLALTRVLSPLLIRRWHRRLRRRRCRRPRLHRRWRRDELLSLIFYEERAAIKTKYNGAIEPCESRADFFAAYPPRRSVFEIPNDETSDNWM